MSPIVVFVHGFWISPEVFQPVADILNKAGVRTDITYQNPSLGTTSPGNPSMDDDIASIHNHVSKLVDAGEDVVLVLHSAGGFLGSNGVKGLLRKDREAAGKAGGVSQIIFISGGIWPVGFTHGDLPFATVNGGSLEINEPEKLLFGDFEPSEAKRLVSALKSQPSQGWNGTVTYAAWQELPSVYIVCTADNALPPPLQEQLAASANSKIEKVDGGHMSMLSKPAEVAQIIQTAVAA